MSLYIFASSCRCQHSKLFGQKLQKLLRLSVGRATIMSSTQMRDDKDQSWQEHKKKYLNMPLGEKRKLYRCEDNYYTLSDLKTWHDFMLDYKQPLFPELIPMLPGCHIDPNLNAEISKKISVFRGDITTLEVDAIVNAANKSLLGGGGVDGAIHRAAGAHLLAENRTHGGCNVGEVKISGGYKLPTKYVISTVGPQGEKPDLLGACYKNAINLLIANNLRSIAFPCISTGIYGYPLLPSAHVSAMQVRQQLEANLNAIDRVVFCVFSTVDEETYHGVLQSYFPLE